MAPFQNRTHRTDGRQALVPSGEGRGHPRVIRWRMLVENFEFNPKGDRLGRGWSFVRLLKDTTLDGNESIFLLFLKCNPKRHLES